MTQSRFLGLGSHTSVRETSTGVEIAYGSERAAVDVVKSDLLRIRVSRAGAFDESPTFALAIEPFSPEARAGRDVAFSIVESDTDVILTTSSLDVRIVLNNFELEVTRKDGTRILDTTNSGELSYYRHLNDSLVSDRSISAKDSILGLGEKTGSSNRRGKTFTLWNNDVLNPTSSGEFTANLDHSDPRADSTSVDFDPYYMSIPFFYQMDGETSDAAGFFIDNGYRGYFDFTSPSKTEIQFDGGQWTEYIFAGPEIADILRDYTWLTGRTSPPPLWALGYHQCRWHAYDHDSLLALARRHQELEIPLDVLWLDIDHMDGYRVFTWNTELFPNIQQTLAELRELGIRVITIVDPGVKAEPGYEVFDSGLANNVFCQTEGGDIYIGQVWPGNTAFPDFVTEEARRWWGDLNATHVKNGLAGIWNDMNEPATGEISPKPMRFGQGKYSHERYHNSYALLMAMGTVDGLQTAMPHLRTFVLSRAGSAGIQRYAANWLGDNMSRWDHLAISIPMATGLGLSGQSFVGADIGGFGENTNAELLSRWIQYGALTPFARNHNMVNQIDQYAFSFGGETTAIAKAAIQLRYRLLPYIYSQFIKSFETGAPVQRPMVFDFQHDPRARYLDEQYMFGDSLLVAPVLEAGCLTREVYLPAGEWFDWYSGRSFESEAGQTITVETPPAEIPVFVKAGAMIPSWSSAPKSTSLPAPEVLDLQVWIPNTDGTHSTFVQEDDGITMDYRSGSFLRTYLVLTRSGKQISLRGTVSGSGFQDFQRSKIRVLFNGVNAAGLGEYVFDNTGEDFDLTFDLEQ
ncbi:MAG: TIM-barrel domain-containing protein [Micrococcales bacterium]